MIAGQERFRSLGPMYTRGSNVVIFVYDVTKKSSFEYLSTRIKETKEQITTAFVGMILGNKTDLPKKVVKYFYLN